MSDHDERGRFTKDNKSGGSSPGRPPKEYSITSILREKGKAVIDPETGQTRADRLAELLMALAEGGDKQAIQYLIDRLDGKPKERIEQEGETVVRVVFDHGENEAPASTSEVLGEPG